MSISRLAPASPRWVRPECRHSVIAQALGYHDKSTTRIASEAGTPWKHYAPGDHSR
ncbi:hypothetical protein [Streptomyces sp. NPDC056672]|uniref:hypothetical protein n=1 Tax=Streptomyces sp. NPDC056672 TaxID=3345906 RepID=UPI0036992107